MGIELAVAGLSLVSGLASADAQRKAGNRASDAQQQAAQLGIDEQHRQFDAIQKLLSPYVNAGTGALTGQMDLLGRNGNDAQSAAIQALQSSPQFTSALQLGENRILANASATGGLRGGNTQAALMQYSPQLLAATINDQYSRLGGLTSLGANAAAGVGNAGMQVGNNVTNLLGQQGAAQAGAFLNQGRQTSNMWSAFGNSFGQALGGFSGYTRPNAVGAYANPTGSTYDYRGSVLPDELRGGV